MEHGEKCSMILFVTFSLAFGMLFLYCHFKETVTMVFVTLKLFAMEIFTLPIISTDFVTQHTMGTTEYCHTIILHAQHGHADQD